jgi:hypothetical protein
MLYCRRHDEDDTRLYPVVVPKWRVTGSWPKPWSKQPETPVKQHSQVLQTTTMLGENQDRDIQSQQLLLENRPTAPVEGCRSNRLGCSWELLQTSSHEGSQSAGDKTGVCPDTWKRSTRVATTYGCSCILRQGVFESFPFTLCVRGGWKCKVWLVPSVRIAR